MAAGCTILLTVATSSHLAADERTELQVGTLHDPANGLQEDGLQFQLPDEGAVSDFEWDVVRLAALADESDGQGRPAAGKSADKNLESAESLGEAPEEQPLQFLRRVTPLLRRGDWQFDTGVTYTLSEASIPVVITRSPGAPVVALDPARRVRQRLLAAPFEVRYGLTNRIQLFAFAPVGWSNNEVTNLSLTSSTPFYEQLSDSVGGIGDLSAGGTFLLRQGSHSRPDIVGTLFATAPTGNSAFPFATFSPQSALGQGYWAVAGNVLVVHSYDPVVLFYGVGARNRFEQTFVRRIVVDPGQEYSYQLGVGFAVNSRVTLSAAYLGSYVVEDKINGVRIEGGNLEPLRMRFAVTLQRPKFICEPFATIGMTDDAPAAHTGITWTF
jgi:hypothetical protein